MFLLTVGKRTRRELDPKVTKRRGRGEGEVPETSGTRKRRVHGVGGRCEVVHRRVGDKSHNENLGHVVLFTGTVG